MRSCLLIWPAVILLLTGCYDGPNNYASLEEARDDAVFDSGSLPDILPMSAYDIQVARDVNLDRFEGYFSFDPADFPRFAAQFESFYQPFEYISGDHTWVFYCDSTSGYCYCSAR
jgi:hypothetical protein